VTRDPEDQALIDARDAEIAALREELAFLQAQYDQLARASARFAASPLIRDAMHRMVGHA
jgi:hypothetical protein